MSFWIHKTDKNGKGYYYLSSAHLVLGLPVPIIIVGIMVSFVLPKFLDSHRIVLAKVQAEKMGLTVLTDNSKINTDQKQIIGNLRGYISENHLDPKYFYIDIKQINPKNNSFDLWHISAFFPENRGMKGNPGGLCRTLYTDSSGHIINQLLWK
ncbi:MAG TPA: hypothetical protein VLX68_07515 [Chitinivibrionales bacterium]|nr:hypothetical protein [Chitinivibrionales bacterium]